MEMKNGLTDDSKVISQEEVERRIVKATTDMHLGYFEIPISTDRRNVDQYMGMLAVFKFNDPIQRNADAWRIEDKSLLIISLIEGVSIGQIKVQIIRKSGKKYRNVLDGKQRLTTIRDFINGKFAINCDRYVSSIDEDGNLIWIDINGMFFDDLPEGFRKKINGSTIEIEEYDIDDSLKYELFKRWNNGVALKPAQLRKAKMSYEMLGFLAKMKEKTVVQAGFSKTALNNDTHADMVLKAMSVLLTDNNTALDNKSLNKLLDEDSFIPALYDETEAIIEYLEQVYPLLDEKAISKSFGSSKTIALIFVASVAKREGRDAQKFAEWMTQFFVKDYTKSGFGSQSGTAKIESVRKRNEIILKHYITYFQG
ncbi:DUF262 domain-containing protein (plasmid) [Paenibacillus thiaminolyticus]|uniref:DUF262 domain-containing protein n=1 Tax=Paenibacillus thiaminolyticus TaxID=49283 RepID=UPI00232D9507|nr:DUF262 domain-containing protein [Paenibacillus thiaminolyticus]WCF11624.1 DUF262 domain-containing protein [Paenibacillus thiaminolyticus]